MGTNRLFKQFRFRSSRNSGKVRCERDWHWKSPSLRDYDLWYVTSGNGWIEINGVTYPVEGGTCFVLRPGDTVSAGHDPDNRLTVQFVHFTCHDNERQVPDASDALTGLPRLVFVEDAVWMEQLLGRLLSLDDDLKAEADDAEFDALVRAALLALARDIATQGSEGRMPAAVRTVIRKIREHASAPLSHAELARIAGLSERYLNVLFKRHTGMSLRTFIAKARIERACRLLEESSLSVGQIAEALGYSDIYFFSRQFKQFAGVAPTAYRQRAAAAFRYGAPRP